MVGSAVVTETGIRVLRLRSLKSRTVARNVTTASVRGLPSFDNEFQFSNELVIAMCLLISLIEYGGA